MLKFQSIRYLFESEWRYEPKLSMKMNEKYIVIIIILFLIGAVFPFLRDVYLASTYGAMEIPQTDKEIWKTVSIATASLVNIGCAVWLFVLSQKASASKYVWPIFGLFFGLVAVGIFYLIRINERLGS